MKCVWVFEHVWMFTCACVCVNQCGYSHVCVQIREVAVATCCDRQVLVEKIHTDIHQVTVEVPVPYQGILKQAAQKISITFKPDVHACFLLLFVALRRLLSPPSLISSLSSSLFVASPSYTSTHQVEKLVEVERITEKLVPVITQVAKEVQIQVPVRVPYEVEKKTEVPIFTNVLQVGLAVHPNVILYFTLKTLVLLKCFSSLSTWVSMCTHFSRILN